MLTAALATNAYLAGRARTRACAERGRSSPRGGVGGSSRLRPRAAVVDCRGCGVPHRALPPAEACPVATSATATLTSTGRGGFAPSNTGGDPQPANFSPRSQGLFPGARKLGRSAGRAPCGPREARQAEQGNGVSTACIRRRERSASEMFGVYTASAERQICAQLASSGSASFGGGENGFIASRISCDAVRSSSAAA